MREVVARTVAGVALSLWLGSGAALAEGDWVPVDPDNTLYMDVSGGTVAIELHPEAAPGHVARIKELAREGFYNGLTFHRVIDDFMAQGGDPLGTGAGGSSKPNLKSEFTFQVPSAPVFGTDLRNRGIGVHGSAVILTQPGSARSDGLAISWMPHCRGVVSMARSDDPDSANSQFFIMLSDTHQADLDRNYTSWGRVIYGMALVDRIQRGEPPRGPSRIYKMRVASDVPEKDRLALEQLSPDSQAMKDLISGLESKARGRLNACHIEVPVRLTPKPPKGTP